MLHRLQLRLKPDVAYNDLKLRTYVSTQLGIDVNRITGVLVTRRSIDARQKQVMINLVVTVAVDEPVPAPESMALSIDYKPVAPDAPVVIVVGAGPAGLFAALRLIELGIRPIVLERGKDVDSRRPDMARIAREGIVDPDSNYCFGEGGAGAFSDGKLYTRSKKRGSVEKILSVLYRHGASADILVDAHPHIGTDRLPSVIRAMRETIIACGGEVRFGCRVTELNLADGEVTGVRTADGMSFSGPVILATGHSARDVYHMLLDCGISLEPKGIAVGVRLEHPQELIDRLQYHSANGRGKYLPAAEYSMLTRVDGRAVYSFCMCPGGFVIPASSAPGQLVVNGMSPSNRGTRWSNSGMVVEVLPEDVKGDDPLKMMHFQEEIEQRFFAASPDGSQKAPAQRLTDFIAGKPSSSLADSSYAPGLYPARVDMLLPDSISSRLQQGFAEFGRKQRGFVTDRATVIGDETRTSSPVRIPRDSERLVHIGVAGLYPAGEGAGYAGGIVSAAIDGERVAEAVSSQIRSRVADR